jgi:hypothetical protein
MASSCFHLYNGSPELIIFFKRGITWITFAIHKLICILVIFVKHLSPFKGHLIGY